MLQMISRHIGCLARKTDEGRVGPLPMRSDAGRQPRTPRGLLQAYALLFGKVSWCSGDMAKVVPFTNNREVIYGLLKRARRHHCTCSSQHDIDITDLLETLDQYRNRGERVSLNACLIRATSLMLERYPRLNHHLFHGLVRKYEVDFEQICCNVIMLRRENREAILLPVLIENSNQLSVRQIDEILDYHQRTPLEQLPQIQGIQKMKRLPKVALKAFSYLARSNHRFYRKFFGTYGYSSMLLEGDDGVRLGDNGAVAQSAANTATGFLPASVVERPVVIDGEIVVRKMLTITVLMDHYVVDGHDIFLATRYLTKLLREPVRLGLESAQSGAKPQSSQSLA